MKPFIILILLSLLLLTNSLENTRNKNKSKVSFVVRGEIESMLINGNRVKIAPTKVNGEQIVNLDLFLFPSDIITVNAKAGYGQKGGIYGYIDYIDENNKLTKIQTSKEKWLCDKSKPGEEEKVGTNEQAVWIWGAKYPTVTKCKVQIPCLNGKNEPIPATPLPTTSQPITQEKKETSKSIKESTPSNPAPPVNSQESESAVQKNEKTKKTTSQIRRASPSNPSTSELPASTPEKINEKQKETISQTTQTTQSATQLSVDTTNSIPPKPTQTNQKISAKVSTNSQHQLISRKNSIKSPEINTNPRITSSTKAEIITPSRTVSPLPKESEKKSNTSEIKIQKTTTEKNPSAKKETNTVVKKTATLKPSIASVSKISTKIDTKREKTKPLLFGPEQLITKKKETDITGPVYPLENSKVVLDNGISKTQKKDVIEKKSNLGKTSKPNAAKNLISSSSKTTITQVRKVKRHNTDWYCVDGIHYAFRQDRTVYKCLSITGKGATNNCAYFKDVNECEEKVVNLKIHYGEVLCSTTTSDGENCIKAKNFLINRKP